MTFTVYSTLAKQVQEFRSLEPALVRMYNCGPTVYSRPHIGNFRAFLFADTLRRWLEYRGFEVRQVMNITDVGHLTDDDRDEGEDKIEARARREKLDPWQISRDIAALFLKDIEDLGVRPALAYPRATDHIPEMLEIIDGLIAKGYAYQVGGNVYYDVAKFERYGKLSGNKVAELDAGARVDVREDKRHPADFALWKSDPQHIMKWSTRFGPDGFPGWHIECSAMARKLLGDRLDIHTGGEDNIFPHHECEIAQSEGAFAGDFVRYWMHARFLQVDGGKMSKSLGNLYTVGQLEQMGHPPIALRFALIRSHYRQVLNFTLDGLRQSAADVRRLRLFAAELQDSSARGSPAALPPSWVREATAKFDAGMNDDLNASAALDGVFSLLNEANRVKARGDDAAAALAALRRMDRVLGLLEQAPASVDAEVEALIAARNAARAARDFSTADSLRAKLANMGIELLDGKDGVKWRRTGVKT